MKYIELFENQLNKKYSKFNLEDILTLKSQLSEEAIFELATSDENLLISKYLKSVIFEQKFSENVSKLTKIVRSGRTLTKSDFDEYVFSESTFNKILGWAFVIRFVDISFTEEIHKEIKEVYDKFIDLIKSLAESKNSSFLKKLLDTAFFVSNIYYYRSGIELTGDSIEGDPLNSILEEMNYEEIKLWPFLNPDILAKLPNINPEQIGVLDITKVKKER